MQFLVLFVSVVSDQCLISLLDDPNWLVPPHNVIKCICGISLIIFLLIPINTFLRRNPLVITFLTSLFNLDSLVFQRYSKHVITNISVKFQAGAATYPLLQLNQSQFRFPNKHILYIFFIFPLLFFYQNGNTKKKKTKNFDNFKISRMQT